MYSIKVRHWNALALTAPRNDARYYLNGIYIDLKNQQAVATDGAVLVAAPLITDGDDATDLHKSVILAPADNGKFTRPAAHSKAPPTVNIPLPVDDVYLVANTGLIVVDGKFPDWKPIMSPANPEGRFPSLGIDLNNLKFIQAFRGRRFKLLPTTEGNAHERAVRVELRDPEAEGLEVLVMPCRI